MLGWNEEGEVEEDGGVGVVVVVVVEITKVSVCR